MDDAALDRILEATGIVVPADFDRRQLADDLESIASVYRAGVELRHRPAEREKLAGRIMAKATDLERCIAEYGAPAHLATALKRLVAEVLLPEARLEHLLGVGEVSAIGRLVRDLRPTFEERFGPSGYTKTEKGDHEGPFIDFAEQALKELRITTNSGRPHARGSIADALREDNRRRNRKNDVDNT